MADFCKQCSLEIFGEDFKDMAGMAPEGQSASVLCEGCGGTQVNHLGECLYHAAAGGTSAACLAAGNIPKVVS
jgi:hypothetical protein